MSIKAKLSTREIDKGFKEFQKQIKNFKGGPYIKIGIQSEEEGVFPKGSKLNLAGIASVNEFGTNKAGPNKNTKIPPRPFIRSTMDEQREYFITVTRNVLNNIMLGSDILQEFNRLGLIIAEKIKAKISSNIPPPNAPSTIKGKGSSKTLIDTGRMRASIRHKVVLDGGDE